MRPPSVTGFSTTGLGLKKARAWRATIVFLDESGFSQRPSIRRTWAPQGQTPQLTQPFNWKRLALIGALATTPQGERTRLLLSIHSGTVNSERVTAFLRGLRRHIPGRVVLLWDGLPSHRSTHTTRFLADHRHWLHVERLPAYAPELNNRSGQKKQSAARGFVLVIP